MTGSSPKLYAIVPAAGIGSRMHTKIAKQYLQVNGLPVLEHTLRCLLQESRIKKIAVAIAEQDLQWDTLEVRSSNRIVNVVGGETRAHSVLNGLDMIALAAQKDDWVLVHDAARPCLGAHSLSKLIDALIDGEHGGILALPARDTLKMAKISDGQPAEVASTLDRATIWHAQTPQMFRLGKLQAALRESLAAGVNVTDEAAAMERAGHIVRLIEGESSNIKITTQQDLLLAQSFLKKAVQ